MNVYHREGEPLMDFQIGQKVRFKESVSWLPVPVGTKATITGFGASGKELIVRTERGSSYWVKAEEVEPVEDGNDEPSGSVPNLTEGDYGG